MPHFKPVGVLESGVAALCLCVFYVLAAVKLRCPSHAWVDAVTAPISLVAPMKFTEVAKHIVRTDEFWQILVPVVNKGRFSKLSPDHQRAIMAAAEETGTWFVDRQEKNGYDDIEKMKRDNGATFKWTPVTANSTKDNIRPVVPKWDARHTALLWMQGKYGTAQSYTEAIVGIILGQ